MGKLNVLLLVTALALVGTAVYLHQSSGGAPKAGLRANVAAVGGRALDVSLKTFQRVSELGTSAGDLLVDRVLAAWQWAGELAGRLDLFLAGALGEPWHSTKTAAGDAGRALSRFSRRAGEQTLALLSYAVRRGWETAGQLWEAGWETAGPLALEWTEAGRRAAADGWAAVQREAPGYAAAAWETTCRLGQQVWKLCCDGWELASTKVPVYAALAAERITQLVASVTG